MSYERLSGGASQETYRIVIRTDAGRAQACDAACAWRYRAEARRLSGPRDRSGADARRARGRRAGARHLLGADAARTVSATASSWSGSKVRRSVRASCAILRSMRSGRSLPSNAARSSRGSMRSIWKTTGLGARLSRLSPGAVRAPDLGALSGARHAAADDRLHRALAARSPAADIRADARSQRLSQRQHHGVARQASSPCSTGRSPTSAIRCATSAGSAPTRGASDAANCRSAASAAMPTCSAAMSACPEGRSTRRTSNSGRCSARSGGRARASPWRSTTAPVRTERSSVRRSAGGRPSARSTA